MRKIIKKLPLSKRNRNLNPEDLVTLDQEIVRLDQERTQAIQKRNS